jgi:hypothetical protein
VKVSDYIIQSGIQRLRAKAAEFSHDAAGSWSD